MGWQGDALVEESNAALTGGGGKESALVGQSRRDTFRQLLLGWGKIFAWVNSAPVKEESLPWGGKKSAMAEEEFGLGATL